MTLKNQINQAYQVLTEHAWKNGVTLLHPQSKYRTLLVAMLINDDNVNSFYYALGPDDTTLENFFSTITHDLASQHPTFGSYLNNLDSDLLQDFEANQAEIIQAFVSELRELSDTPYLLIFDEYDRADSADSIHRFLEKLVDHLPQHCHIVLNTRDLPRLPWVSMIAKSQAALLLDEHLVQENFYGNRREGAYDLEVYALGPSRVINQGKTIENWEGHLPRLLFFFALDKPIVTRSEICDAFWPDLAIDQAVNVFHVTKRRLHKALGVDALVHQENYYQINPEFNVYYDVLDFVETLVRARNAENGNAAQAWQHAIDLYKGSFLQGHSEIWIDERREAFRMGYVEALTALAGEWLHKDNQDAALRLYLQALEADYGRQDVHHAVIQLYTNMGRSSEAVEHFQKLESTMKDKGVALNEELVSLYGMISS